MGLGDRQGTMDQEISNRPYQSNFKNPGSEQKNLQTAKAGRMKVPRYLW